MSTKKRYYLKEWRERRGWSQEQLEEASNVSQQTISSIETHPNRDRKPKIITKLAAALGIEWSQLQTDPGTDSTGEQPPRKDPRDMTPDELWEGFDALYMGGELSEKDIIDRLVRLRIEMEKRGIK